MGFLKTLLFPILGLASLSSALSVPRGTFVGPDKPYAGDASFTHPGLSAGNLDEQFPQTGTELWDKLNASVTATTLLQAGWKESKRGVAYNNANYPKLFNIPRSKVSWMYNWWSMPGGKTDVWYEFIPMIHSSREEHTDVWFSSADHCQKVLGSIGVFSFNEPDQCG